MKKLVLALILVFGFAGFILGQLTFHWYNSKNQEQEIEDLKDMSPSLAQPIYRWYNFKNQQMEDRQDIPSAEKMREYIPQIVPAQGLYDVYLKMGKPHLEAAVLVLEAVGETETR